MRYYCRTCKRKVEVGKQGTSPHTGVVHRYCSEGHYLRGEDAVKERKPMLRRVRGALGWAWGKGKAFVDPRRSWLLRALIWPFLPQYHEARIVSISQRGGVVTVDVPLPGESSTFYLANNTQFAVGDTIRIGAHHPSPVARLYRKAKGAAKHFLSPGKSWVLRAAWWAVPKPWRWEWVWSAREQERIMREMEERLEKLGKLEEAEIPLNRSEKKYILPGDRGKPESEQTVFTIRAASAKEIEQFLNKHKKDIARLLEIAPKVPPPAWGDILDACGMKATVGESVEFKPLMKELERDLVCRFGVPESIIGPGGALKVDPTPKEMAEAAKMGTGIAVTGRTRLLDAKCREWSVEDGGRAFKNDQALEDFKWWLGGLRDVKIGSTDEYGNHVLMVRTGDAGLDPAPFRPGDRVRVECDGCAADVGCSKHLDATVRDIVSVGMSASGPYAFVDAVGSGYRGGSATRCACPASQLRRAEEGWGAWLPMRRMGRLGECCTCQECPRCPVRPEPGVKACRPYSKAHEFRTNADGRVEFRRVEEPKPEPPVVKYGEQCKWDAWAAAAIAKGPNDLEPEPQAGSIMLDGFSFPLVRNERGEEGFWADGHTFVLASGIKVDGKPLFKQPKASEPQPEVSTDNHLCHPVDTSASRVTQEPLSRWEDPNSMRCDKCGESWHWGRRREKPWRPKVGEWVWWEVSERSRPALVLGFDDDGDIRFNDPELHSGWNLDYIRRFRPLRLDEVETEEQARQFIGRKLDYYFGPLVIKRYYKGRENPWMVTPINDDQIIMWWDGKENEIIGLLPKEGGEA